MWAYLHRVLWNWAGILLSVDATVALLERYLGEIVERWLHWRPHIPALIKIGFAIVVLFIAQGQAYQDTQKELAQAGKDNDGLHAAVDALKTQITSQQREIDRLRSVPPKIVTRTIPAQQPGKSEQFSVFSPAELLTLNNGLRPGDRNTIAIVSVGDPDASAVSSQIQMAFRDAGWNVVPSMVGSLNITVVGDAGGGRVKVEGLYLISRDADSPLLKKIAAAFELAGHPVSVNGSAYLRPRGDLTIYVIHGNQPL